MSACIIPVGPKFQDPPGSPNYAPYVVSATPDFGSVVSIVTSLRFEVTVTDPNVEDDLYFRWVADYPKYTTSTRRLGDEIQSNSTDGTPLLNDITIDCSDDFAMTADSKHQLEVIVADRPYQPSTDNQLDEVEPPGFVVHTSWGFEITCQSPPSQ